MQGRRKHFSTSPAKGHASSVGMAVAKLDYKGALLQ